MIKSLFIALAFVAVGTCVRAQIIETIAGNDTAGYRGDGGPAVDAVLDRPYAIALDRHDNIYFTDVDNERIRKISTSGIITTVAGNGSLVCPDFGHAATATELKGPDGICFDPAGNMYIADYSCNCVLKVDTDGIVSDFAGICGSLAVDSGDGCPATNAKLYQPLGIRSDKYGNIYISTWNNIKKVNTYGIITDFAGSTSLPQGFSGDGGPATAAQLSYVIDLVVDTIGNVYFSDQPNNRVRKVDTAGIITTVAGSGAAGLYVDDGGPATAASIFPGGLALDGEGNLYVENDQAFSGFLLKVNTAGIISVVAGTGLLGYSGDGGPATAAEISGGYPVVDKAGNLYMSDIVSNTIRRIYAPEGVKMAGTRPEITVTPNPATDQVQVSCPTASAGNWAITDMLGRTALQGTMTQRRQTIYIALLLPGCYVVTLYQNDTVVGRARLVKQ